MSWFVPQVGNHRYKGLLLCLPLFSLLYLYHQKMQNIVPLVWIRQSLMTFSIAKLKGRQTEVTPYLDQLTTFEGSDKSACTLTLTQAVSHCCFLQSHHPIRNSMLFYGSDQQLSVRCIICCTKIDGFQCFCSPIFARI